MAAKLALIVRTDLGMGRGKIAAQVAHAAVAAVLATSHSRDFAAWLAEALGKELPGQTYKAGTFAPIAA